MKSILILIIITTNIIFASEIIHSSVSTYYENKSFSNSVQKIKGEVYGIGADIHYRDSEYKVAYEYGNTITKKPPLPSERL